MANPIAPVYDPTQVYGGVDMTQFMSDPDEERDAQSRASKMIAALRNQQMQGSLLKMTGAPALAGLGQDMITSGDKGIDSAVRYGPEAQMLRKTLGLYGMGAKLGVQGMKGQAARDTQGMKDQTAITVGAGHDAARIEAARLMAAFRGTAMGIQQAKQTVGFGKDFDPDMNPGMKPMRDIVFQIDRLNALAKGDDGAVKDLDESQLHEMAMGLHRVFTGANRTVQAQVAALVPQNIARDANLFARWWASQPTGMGQRKFVQLMADTLDRERVVSTNKIKAEQAKVIARWSPWIGENWETAARIAQASGYDPDEMLTAIGGHATSPGQVPQPGDPDLNVGVAPVPPGGPRKPAAQPPKAPPAGGNPGADRIQKIKAALADPNVSEDIKAQLQAKLKALGG